MWTVEDTILVIVSSPVSSISHPVSVFGVFLLIVTSSDRDQHFVISSGGWTVEKIPSQHFEILLSGQCERGEGEIVEKIPTQYFEIFLSDHCYGHCE